MSDTEAIIRNGQFHPLLIPKHYDIDIHFLSRIFDRILYQVRQDIRHMYRIGRQIRHIRGKGRRERDFFPGGDIGQAYHLLHQLTEVKSGRSQERLPLVRTNHIFQFSQIGGKIIQLEHGVLKDPFRRGLIHPHLPVIQERDEYLQGLYRSPQLMDHRMHESLTQLVQAHLLPDRTDLETQTSQQ